MVASLLAAKLNILLRHSTLFDWLFFIGSWIKHPIGMFRLIKARSSLPAVAHFLDETTADLCSRVRKRETSAEQI